MTTAEIERRDAEEAFEQGYYGIPHSDQRAGMSPEKLAIELSRLEKGSPPYILIEHELNLRLAKEQAKATLSAGWIGAGATILAVFIAAALGYLAGTLQLKEPNDGPREKQATHQTHTANGEKTRPVPPASTHSPKTFQVPMIDGDTQNSKEQGNESPKP